MKPHIRLKRLGTWYAAYVYASRAHESSRMLILSEQGFRAALAGARKRWPDGWWPA